VSFSCWLHRQTSRSVAPSLLNIQQRLIDYSRLRCQQFDSQSRLPISSKIVVIEKYIIKNSLSQQITSCPAAAAGQFTTNLPGINILLKFLMIFSQVSRESMRAKPTPLLRPLLSRSNTSRHNGAVSLQQLLQLALSHVGRQVGNVQVGRVLLLLLLHAMNTLPSNKLF
jgi:hypothetical protein